MPSVRLRKILRDLGSSRARTILVVLSIAVGVIAVGVIATARIVLLRELNATYAAAAPGSATLSYVSREGLIFDQRLVKSVRRVPEVRDAEERAGRDVQVQIGDDWRQMRLVAIPDFNDIRLNKIWPQIGALVRIAVTDTGISIPAEELPHLFSRFHRGRNASAYPGSGLGLAIVNAIVARHGGQISVQSTAAGTCVVIQWPCAAPRR